LAAAAIVGLKSSGAEIAALIFIIGRAAFAVPYYTGIPLIRVPAFLMGALSILFIAMQSLLLG